MKENKNLRGRSKPAYGQNFLVNGDIARGIIDYCGFSADDCVVEIGPGEGALTSMIAGKVRSFTVIEIDPFYYSYIKGKFGGNKPGYADNTGRANDGAASGNAGFTSVLNMDALKFGYLELSKKLSCKLRVISNLPYEISSPVTARFTVEKEAFSDLTLMFQKEFAERLTAKEDDSSRGALSVMAGLNFDIEKVMDVGKENFNPRPKVDSAVLRLKPRMHEDEDFAWASSSGFFSYFVHDIFKLRRKKLKNSIYASFFGIPPDVKEKIFSELGIDLNKRPQELTDEELVKAGRLYDGYLENAEEKPRR